jgi:hypothetical protein
MTGEPLWVRLCFGALGVGVGLVLFGGLALLYLRDLRDWWGARK